MGIGPTVPFDSNKIKRPSLVRRSISSALGSSSSCSTWAASDTSVLGLAGSGCIAPL